MLIEATGCVVCPRCNHKALARVTDSRRGMLRDGSLTQHRRRECYKCRWRWNTVEVSAPEGVEVDWLGDIFGQGSA